MTARNMQDEVKKKGLPWSAVKLPDPISLHANNALFLPHHCGCFDSISFCQRDTSYIRQSLAMR
jgi:hypothetical protein